MSHPPVDPLTPDTAADLAEASQDAPPNVVAAGLTVEQSPITARVDRDEQDRLMLLRAREEEVLYTRFANRAVVLLAQVAPVASTNPAPQVSALAELQQLAAPLIAAQGGMLLGGTKSPLLACFAEPMAAITAAVALGRAVRVAQEQRADLVPTWQVEIAVALGTAQVTHGTLTGEAVERAQRLLTCAAGDQILATREIRAEAGHWSWSEVLSPAPTAQESAWRLEWAHEPTARLAALTSLPRPQALPPRFEIKTLLHHGGMGMLLAADDTEQHRPVVIKLLHPHVAEMPELRRHLQQELCNLQRLSDPGVVPMITASCPPEGEVFWVTPRVAGINLKQLVHLHGTPPLHEIAYIGHAVGEILAQAHKEGVVHGDLKPENVLIDKAGHLQLTDVGLSRTWSRLLDHTTAPLGDPAYLAPESLGTAMADPRHDIYSLGALLYFLATGQSPVSGGATLEGLRAAMSGRIQPLGSVRPQLSAEFVAIVEKAMAVPSGRRFSTISLCTARLAKLIGTGSEDTGEHLAHQVSDATDRVAVFAPKNDATEPNRQIPQTTHSLSLYLTLGILIIVLAAVGGLVLTRIQSGLAERHAPSTVAPAIAACAIALDVPVDAAVFLDGKLLGTGMPHRELAVEPGRHLLRVERGGKALLEQVVEARAGAVVRIQVPSQ